MRKAVAGYGLRMYQKAIMNATWNDDFPSSENHIQYLIASTSTDNPHNLAVCIHERISCRGSWKVVLKAISLIHRLVRDANESFAKDLLHLPQLFNIDAYLDQSTSEAVCESQFISFYVQYLRHKLHIYDELGYWIERKFREDRYPMEWISSLPIQELKRVFQLVLTSLEKLTCCDPQVHYNTVHPIEGKALVMLFRDSLRLYSFLTMGIFQMIDQVNSLDSLCCERIAIQIKQFSKLNTKYKTWAQNLASLHVIDPRFLPDFETIPAGTIDNLQTLLIHMSQQVSTSSRGGKSGTPKEKASMKPSSKKQPNSKALEKKSQFQPREMDLLGLADSVEENAKTAALFRM